MRECAIMDVQGRFSISAQALYPRLGTELAPIIIDVRRSLAFEADDTVIVGAVRRPPEEVDHWRSELTEGRSVVVYCAHGQKYGSGATRCRERRLLPRTWHWGLGRARAAAPPQARCRIGRVGHPRAAQNRPHRLPLV